VRVAADAIPVIGELRDFADAAIESITDVCMFMVRHSPLLRAYKYVFSLATRGPTMKNAVSV
jgi:hypothetical protein